MSGLSTVNISALPYELLLSQVHDSINGTDANGILHTWNLGAERIFGYKAEEVIGKHVSLLIFPEDQPTFYETVIEPVLKYGEHEVVVRNRRKDGAEIFVALRLSVVRSKDGRVEHIIGCANDITAQKKAEDALRVEMGRRESAKEALAESEARYRYLLAQSPAIVYSCRAYGDYGATFVSENAEALFGYPASAYTEAADFWMAHIHPDDRDKIVAKLISQLESGKAFIEYRYLHRDGKYRWIRDSAVVIRDAEGNPLEMIGHMLDVTREKEAEEERFNHERLRFFSEALLSAQEEERKRISRELHDDLNQRLAALIMDIGLLEKRRPSTSDANRRGRDAIKAKIADISDEVRRIALQLHSAGLEHFGLAAALEHECISLSERSGVKFHFKISDIPEKLPDDVSLCLYRVAQESMRNVIKHSGAREAEVCLCAKDGPPWIVLRVEDRGCGFDPVEARTRMTLGYISMNERLRQVDGMLSLTSAPGRGTRVEAKIPFLRNSITELGA